MLFDLQKQLPKEADALVFKLLPLLKHLLHVLHVLRSQLVKLFQRLLVAFFSLGGKQSHRHTWMHMDCLKIGMTYHINTSFFPPHYGTSPTFCTSC